MRKEFKKKGKSTLKKHYPFLVFICLLSAFIGSEFIDSILVIQNKFSMNDIQKFLESGSSTRGARGALSYLFNNLSSGDIYTNILAGIDSLTHSDNLTIIILILLSLLLSFIITYFIQGVLQVILRRGFLEARTYDKVPISRVNFYLKLKRWGHIAFVMFVKNIYYALWSLTIVGGFIKRYSYLMVPYILAENPNIKANEAITLSREMMNGHKWEMFKFDMSYILYWFLGAFTLGLSDILFTNPYKLATESEYFVKFRNDALKNKLKNSEYFNDTYLYEKASKELLEETYNVTEVKVDFEFKGIKGFLLKNFGINLYKEEDTKKYEESRALELIIKNDLLAKEGKIYPTKLSNIPYKDRKKQIENVNYLKGYSITNLILFFFIFSLVGYLWEVSLHLITDGVFVNRGVLFGPWLPIYGWGCLLILIVLNRFRDKPRLEFILAIILCGIVEYFTSYYLEITHGGTRWWDYSGYFLNLNGRICAEGLLVFGLGGMVVVYVIAPLLDKTLRKYSKNILNIIAIILICLFITDQVHSKTHPNMGKGITDYKVSEKD